MKSLTGYIGALDARDVVVALTEGGGVVEVGGGDGFVVVGVGVLGGLLLGSRLLYVSVVVFDLND